MELKLQNYTQQNIAENDRKFGLEQVKRILDSNVSILKNLCKRASIEPKRDNMGNVYFSKDDIMILKKVKELHLHTLEMQKKNKLTCKQLPEPVEIVDNQLTNLDEQVLDWEVTLSNLENNIVQRISKTLSDKMDGLDEVVVELIRAKTENETLRQRVNTLNKENFNLKNENSSYKSIGMGLYVKRNTDDFVL